MIGRSNHRLDFILRDAAETFCFLITRCCHLVYIYLFSTVVRIILFLSSEHDEATIPTCSVSGMVAFQLLEPLDVVLRCFWSLNYT